MPRYAVIDLGSNSIRLVIYKTLDNIHASITAKDFRVILNEKKITGLAAYVQNGILTQSGIDKATEVLAAHVQCAENFDCVETRIFATAVLRNCKNSHEATKAISHAVGVPIDVLSEREEAHLGFVGATCNHRIDCGTLIDIGGGSTELSAIRDNVEEHGMSLAEGCVSTYAKYVKKIFPNAKERHEIESSFEQCFNNYFNTQHNAHKKDSHDITPYCAEKLYGIGGAPRAAMRMYTEAFCENEHPQSLTRKQIEEIIDLYDRNPSEFCHLAVKASPDRLHTLIPGCIIIKVLMRKLNASTLEICKHGVREGYLIKRILEKHD